MEIELKLEREDVDYILNRLADLPFREVYKLISKIQSQGKPQAENADQTT